MRKYIKYIIMGPQGCGKGTQAQLLCKRLELVHISVGDIFRWNIQAHTKLAVRIRRIVDSGALVPTRLSSKSCVGASTNTIGITALPTPALPPVQS